MGLVNVHTLLELIVIVAVMVFNLYRVFGILNEAVLSVAVSIPNKRTRKSYILHPCNGKFSFKT